MIFMIIHVLFFKCLNVEQMKNKMWNHREIKKYKTKISKQNYFHNHNCAASEQNCVIYKKH